MEFIKKKDFYEGTIPFDLLNQDITILLDESDGPDFAYAETCVKALNQLSDQAIDRLCEASLRYCYDFCDIVGEEPPKINASREILMYIEPNSMIIEKVEDDSVVIHLELECSWEEEHGLEWLIKDEQVLYVGPFSNVTVKESQEEYAAYGNYVQNGNG